MPLKILPVIRSHFPSLSFIHIDPTEEFPFNKSNDIVIIDSVTGIEKATVFTSLDDFTPPPQNSVHDFDLYISLRLLRKLKKIRNITIIGIPCDGEEKKVAEEVIQILSSSGI